MKTIDLTAEAPSVDDLMRLASEGNLILRAADGREFLLAEVDDFEREVALVRQQPELLEFLRGRSRAGGGVSLEQAKKALGLAP